jgi:hypothetical protein
MAESATTPPAAVPAELLERELEIEVLEAALAAVVAGAGRLAVIDGAAGIGKTALLRERAHAGGVAVLSARGGELERTFPFGVVRQLFEPVVARAAHRTARRPSRAPPRSPPRSSGRDRCRSPTSPTTRAPSPCSTASIG